MDIRNWSLDRIMQLPDCCFGRQWPVGVTLFETTMATFFDISELALPEKCVIWNLSFSCPMYSTTAIHTSLALGDHLPAADAEFDAMEPLFRDIGVVVAGRRVISFAKAVVSLSIPMRMPVVTAGQRLVGRFEVTTETATHLVVVIIASSIPTEAPDWLVSV